MSRDAMDRYPGGFLFLVLLVSRYVYMGFIHWP